MCASKMGRRLGVRDVVALGAGVGVGRGDAVAATVR
jgi:hypothetical protein